MDKAAMRLQFDPWQLLADDETAWQNLPADKSLRKDLLALFTSGSPAVPAADFKLSEASITLLSDTAGIFGSCIIKDKPYIVPARLIPVVRFFASRPLPEGSIITSQEAALTRMLAGDNTLISGGPGTGKSHLIGRFIHEMNSLPRYPLRPTRIVIAAPTGKAAARHAKIPKGKNILLETLTLHRLLGISSTGTPRFHAENTLPWDIVIIDEISMVDLGLLALLLQAMPAGAQLILAGDLRQLPAVEGIAIDQTLGFLTTQGLAVDVRLEQAYRFSAGKAALYARIFHEGIAGLSGESGELKHEVFTQINQLYAYLTQYAEQTYLAPDTMVLRKKLLAIPFASLAASELLHEAFAFIKSRIILTELREGVLGSTALSAHIGRIVAESGAADRTLTPVIATQNNYTLGLYNGDSGFLLTHGGREFAVFETSEGKYRVLALDTFSGWQVAYALTTHKSQGSEYSEVFVIYEKNRVRSDNRLLYTAVTRAKDSATILEMDLK
jgi:exodeoxyribonuclease V alpha subunit